MPRRRPKPPTAAIEPASAPVVPPAAIAPEPEPPEPTPPAAEPPAGRPPPAFAVRADYAAGVTLLEDRRFRQVQLRFADKPPEGVRVVVREAGFQWRAAEGVWTKQLDPDHGWRTRADAERLFDRVADLLRDGRDAGPGVG